MAEQVKATAAKTAAKSTTAAKPATKTTATKPAAKATAPVANKTTETKTTTSTAKTTAKSTTAAKPAVKKEVKKSDKQIKVTLIKSTNKCVIGMKKTVQALGLRRIGESKIHNDNPAIRGAIFKVKHLVKVEELNAKEAK